MNYYLGFDAGTQSVKVAVYDENMNCIVSSSAPTTLTYPEPGWVSMDVDEYLDLMTHQERYFPIIRNWKKWGWQLRRSLILCMP